MVDNITEYSDRRKCDVVRSLQMKNVAVNAEKSTKLYFKLCA